MAGDGNDRAGGRTGPLALLFAFLFLIGVAIGWAWLQGSEPPQPDGQAAVRMAVTVPSPPPEQARPGDSGATRAPDPPPAPPAPADARAPEPKAAEPPPRQAAAAPPPAPAPAPKPDPRLRPAPDPNLVQPGPFGPLPRIAPDGRAPWQVYARPFDQAERRPRIAIVIGDLGYSAAATTAAIEKLPPEITLAFAPYADDLQGWIARARTGGHEVMLQLPMEPLDYPTNNPGPRALMTAAGLKENLSRLDWMLSRVQGYVGVTNYMGSKFTTSTNDMRPILEQVRDRGLLFVDSRSSQRSVAAQVAREVRMPHAANNRFIDNEASRTSIDARLEELERVARESGTALGLGYPYPVTIERVAAWATGLERKGLVLAPVSAIVTRP